ncbi:MAG TPA: hypothetical protein VF959_00900, partial [Casimicrobiaceae bacterium]
MDSKQHEFPGLCGWPAANSLKKRAWNKLAIVIGQTLFVRCRPERGRIAAIPRCCREPATGQRVTLADPNHERRRELHRQAEAREAALGARRIRELRVRRLDGDMRVPAKSTIHAVLHRHGLVKAIGRPVAEP